jgi:bifunctional non-homologous end joining protein LigD
MGLLKYHSKGNFNVTDEPRVRKTKSSGPLSFVVQEHHASKLYYDFRLELDGVLRSWAIPKGPSLNPTDKRLAVQMEDHPLEYAQFEGSILEDQYGAGEVAVWDDGTWTPLTQPQVGLEKGRLDFELHGRKLTGRWRLLRMPKDARGNTNWLLIKQEDPSGPAAKRHVSEIAGIRITHPERMIYPEQQITKKQVAEYYDAISPYLLPFLHDRPLSVVRCQERAGRTCFYQKHTKGARGLSGTRELDASLADKKASALWVETQSELVRLIQAGAIEIHCWGSRFKDIGRPDVLIFDLDPESKKLWKQVVQTAHELRSMLKKLELKSFVKVTGGKGLHVHVPIEPEHSWDAVRDFARTMFKLLEEKAPELYTTNMRMSERRNRILLDYLRNGYGATSIVPYGLRAKPQATLALPVSWRALTPKLKPDQFRLPEVLLLLQRRKDPWKDYWRTHQRLKALGKPPAKRTRATR